MFNETCKGLADDDTFSGKREDCNDFLKPMERSFEDVRVMEDIELTMKWENYNTDLNIGEFPTPQGVINMYKSNRLPKEQIREHVDLV